MNGITISVDTTPGRLIEMWFVHCPFGGSGWAQGRFKPFRGDTGIVTFVNPARDMWAAYYLFPDPKLEGQSISGGWRWVVEPSPEDPP